MAINAFPWTTFSGDPVEVRQLVDAALELLGDGWEVKWPPELGEPADPDAQAKIWLENPPWVFPPENVRRDAAKKAFRDALYEVHPGSD